MDSPSLPPPRDQEKEILAKLVEIRDQLMLRKLDRTTYIRTQDVMVLYKKVTEQVKKLNEVRHGALQTEENRVDRVVDSCFQLLSLFFMTIGRNNEAPAAYALTSTIRRILDHLTEVNYFSSKDLESMSQTLERLSGIVCNKPATKAEPYLETLISNRIERCRASLSHLKKKLDAYDESLLPTYEKLISILRQMAAANTRTTFASADIVKLQAQVKEVEAQKSDGHWRDSEGNILDGSDQVSELLETCQRFAQVIMEKNGRFPEQWQAVYETLRDIRNELDKLSLTQAWSLRETDLYDYQRQLDLIDESRVDGNWVDENGEPAEPYVQKLLLYLIRRSYGYIYHLMISSEPVSEALLPIYNQLQTLKRCLLEVKDSGGVSSARELYPYSMKLHSIDNMRVDGKFIVGGDIPEGQGNVHELLAECFELTYEMRVAAEAQAEAEEKAEVEAGTESPRPQGEQ